MDDFRQQNTERKNTNKRNAELIDHPETQNADESESYRWIRSTEGWLAGVCEGLAKSFGLPVQTLRIAWVVFSLLALGLGVLLYLILAVCLPDENSIPHAQQRRGLGVCLRLSRAFRIEVGLIRALTILMGLASFGVTVVGYILLHFVVPERPKPLR